MQAPVSAFTLPSLSFPSMHPNLSDPNNHVPDVSADDCWDDDEEECLSHEIKISTVLPPRRTVADRASAETTGEIPQSGLRIESNLVRVLASEPLHRIEVQEFNGDVIRLEEAETPPPKVARQVKYHERGVRAESEKGPRGEGREWGIADRTPVRWTLAAGAGVAAIVILAMVFLPMFNAMNAPKIDPEKGALKVEIEEKIEGMEAQDRLLMKQSEAMQIFRAYAQAVDSDEIVPLVRNGAAMKEALRAHWQPLEVSKSWAPASNSSWGVMEQAGHACALLEGTLPDHSKFTAYFINEGDRLLLDWKATSVFSSAPFTLLEQNRGDPSEIRGMISTADYYTSAWPEEDYQCYRFLSPDGQSSLWCYGRRDSQSGAAINELFRKGEIIEESQSSRKITLRLERGPAEAQPNQWLIGEMLHIDWLAP